MDAESYKILEADMEGKGVSVQSNPMELPEAEAKAVFDQLVKEVVVPKFNKMVDALGAIDLTSDAAKPVSSATQAALNLKVDKEKKTGSTTENKVLSDNNYSDGEQQKVAAAELARHTHGNKTILDGITEEDLSDWRGGNVLTKDNVIPYEPTGQYNPATVGYVNQKVVDIGAADMTKAVYDPNGKGQDIFAYADAVALDAKVMTDDTTGEGYVMGMNGGALYCAGLEEGAPESYVARQDTLLETKAKVDAVQDTASQILQKPSSGGGHIVFPTKYTSNYLPILSQYFNNSDTYLFVNSLSTMSGRGELHVFKYSSNKHFIWDGITYEEQPDTPRPFKYSSFAICGNKNSKSIHVLGGESYTTRHDRYDVKTRAWTQESSTLYDCTNGIACGEAFTSGGAMINNLNYLFYLPRNSSYLYKFDDDTKVYTRISSNVRGTISAECMVWYHSATGDDKLLICGGTDGTSTAYTDYYIYDVVAKTSTTIARVFSTSRTYTSFGFVSKFSSAEQYYYFNGSSLSTGDVRSTRNNARFYSFISNNIVHEISNSYLCIPLYFYKIYLPKNTKIFSASHILKSESQADVSSYIPCFPTLKIVGDAFVVEESSVVPYCTGTITNLNTGAEGSASNGVLLEGFYIEIGSGE